MPNLDGTGPGGLGPMTGRRRGRCISRGNAERKDVPVQPNAGEVFALGRGGRPFGGGRGNCLGGSRRGNGRRRGR